MSYQDPEVRREYARKYREANKEKLRLYHQMRYEDPEIREKKKEASRQFRKRNKDNPEYKAKVRKYERTRYKKKMLDIYGLELGQYDRMLEAQGGVCAICHGLCDRGGALSVDHDHTSGAVRGLLCNGCNVGLGGFRDDPERLRAAILYLEKYLQPS